MRVLHVISSGGMYGAESVIINLSRTLNREGHASILGVFSNSANPNHQLHEHAAQEGIESHLISCSGQVDRTVPAAIHSLARSVQADVVHAHGYKADIYSFLGVRRSRLALVSTCHNWLDDGRLVSLYGSLDRYFLGRFDAVVAVSDEVKRRLVHSRVPAGKISQIRNGIDLRPFDGATASLRAANCAAGTLFVGWVGRLSAEKGPDLFVRAAADVERQIPGTRFVLAGDGPDRTSLEQLIEELGCRNSILLAGRRTDMPSVYASFDVMVSSSRREGLPMAILEGMASRVPWVATAVGDVPSLIQDGDTGVLVAPESSEAIAKALASLLRSPENRERLSANARDLVQTKYSAEQMTSEYLRVYGRAIKGRAEQQETEGRRSAGRGELR